MRVWAGSCQTAEAARTLPWECPEMTSLPRVSPVQPDIRDARSGTARSA